MNNRIFMFCNQKCLGNTGGGQGVEYRLYQANQEYGLLDDIYYVYADRVIHNNEPCEPLPKTINSAAESALKNSLKRWIPKPVISEISGWRKKRRYQEERIRVESYLRELDSQYHFAEEDVYIFHDQQVAEPFTKLFPFKKTMMVSHAQGSLYYEWAASTGYQSKILQKYYNRLFTETMEKLMYLGFPAKGAEESLISSEPALADVVLSSRRRYLHNGVHVPELPQGEENQYALALNAFDGIKFATVATLNEAKAVERIPEYLGALKAAGRDFRWILVGKGVKEEDVRVAIEKHQLEEKVIWINDYISHDDILQILSATDFYILLHKFSIFDLSTLEAMHYGNIPILTPVGGNKEVIVDDNGLFVDDFSNVTELLKLLEDPPRMAQMKEKNCMIQRTYFNDEAYLKRYADAAAQMAKE